MSYRMRMCCIPHREVKTIGGKMAIFRLEGKRKIYEYQCSQCGYCWEGEKDGQPKDEQKRGWK